LKGISTFPIPFKYALSISMAGEKELTCKSKKADIGFELIFF
jgi:hypothetical protein